MAADRELLRRQLEATLGRTDLAGRGGKYEGKVRDNYVSGDGRRVIVVTDRLSAFDRVITTIPFKGQVLNRTAQHWFEQTAHLAPNHLVSSDPTDFPETAGPDVSGPGAWGRENV